MRGPDTQQSSMFSYLSPEERVPAKHPLRPVRLRVDDALKSLSPAFSRLYSAYGRPSIPPEKLLRALLLQVLYTVRSGTAWSTPETIPNTACETPTGLVVHGTKIYLATIHGTNRASVALYTILRTSCTRCARRNSRCSRFGSFGPGRTILDWYLARSVTRETPVST